MGRRDPHLEKHCCVPKGTIPHWSCVPVTFWVAFQPLLSAQGFNNWRGSASGRQKGAAGALLGDRRNRARVTGGTEQELQLERAGASLCGFGGDQLFCCPASTTLCPEVQNHQGINRNYVHFLLHTRVCCSSCVPPWGYFTSQIPQNVSTQPSCRGQKEICSWCNPCVHKPFPQCSHRVMGWQFHQTKASFVISLLKTEHKASFADLPVFGPAWLSHSCFFQACPHPSCTSGAVGGTRTGTKEAGGGFYLKFQVMLSECVRHKNLSQI